MSTLNEKTNIPLAWAVAIIVSLVSVVSSAAVGNYRLGKVEDEAAELKREQKVKDNSDQTTNLRLQRVEDKIDALTKTLESIDKSLKRP